MPTSVEARPRPAGGRGHAEPDALPRAVPESPGVMTGRLQATTLR